MKFTENKVKEINKTFKAMVDTTDVEIEIYDGFGGTRISINSAGCCPVDKLGSLIEELQTLKRAIEEETGLEL